MQVIIDEIVNNVRVVDRDTAMSPAVMRQMVDACLRAVRDMLSHDGRVKEEHSIDGAWALQPRGER